MKSLLTSLHTVSLDDSQPADLELEKLIDEVTALLQVGEPINLERLAEVHPQYVDQIRELLPAMEMLARLGEAPVEKAATNGQASALPQQQLGDFRLIRELGRGGMGVVYEAEQISLGRRVALKVLPFAGMLDQQQLARFKNEARAAATLKHPHIVSVYSVGCERSVHYFAMELVEGQSLAQLIATLRNVGPGEAQVPGLLSAEETADFATSNQQQAVDTMPAVALPTVRAPVSKRSHTESRLHFRTVARWGIEAAEAFDHAHQNGVLHRDIKPANLLIDNAGKLWVTDFGLARMEIDAGMTLSGDLLGTLRYMSPEQALAKRVVVDHRSDIYSLGVTLYELLTLQPAFGETDRSELLKQIAFEEPRAPRQIDGHIPAELETIILKAMRKPPSDRYSTAHELADDLQRFLENKPIKAKPPTWREQATKWSRRHPAAIWAAVFFLLATTVVSAVSAVLIANAYNREAAQRKLAEVERARSDENFRRSIAISNAVLNASFGDGEWASLPSNLRNKLAEQARQHHELLLQESSSDPRLQFERAIGYNSLAEMHYRRTNSSEAEPLFRQSVAIFERLCKEHPETFAYHQNLAQVNHRLGATLFSLGQHDEAKSRLETSFGIYRDVVLRRDDGDWRQALACANDFATELQWRGDTSSAQFKELIATCQKLVARTPTSAFAHGILAELMAKHGSYDQAIAEYRQAIRLDPKGPDLRNNFGRVLQSRGLVDESIAEYREAIRLNPAESAIHNNLAHALSNKGLHEEAIAEYREASRLQPSNPTVHFNLGTMLIENDLLNEGIVELREALRLNPKDSIYQSQLVDSLVQAGAIDEAISAGREAVRLNPTEATGHNNLSKALWKKGMVDEALSHLKEAIHLSPDDPVFRHNLGAALYDEGLLDEAILEFRKAMQMKPDEATFHYRLGRALSRKGLQDEAISALQEAIRLRPNEAMYHYDCGNVFHAKGLLSEATEEYHQAISTGRGQIRQNPNAWAPLATLVRVLATCRDTSLRDQQEAVELAKRAVEALPLVGDSWNSLGVAEYRLGNYRGALEALQKSHELHGDKISTYLYYAMAEWQVGNQDSAREWYAKGIKWLEQRPQIVGGDPHHLRAESEELLGTPAPVASEGVTTSN